MSKKKLSLCMIVKNEERFLEDCLKSVQDVVDQIVIVDTGSTDGTLEIAKKYNTEIHRFKWRDDFSLARNESIKYAKGDWILWLDADERLLPESVPELKKLLQAQTKAVAYVVQIRNLQADGRNYKISGAHRLFNNHKGIRFRGRIHEQVIQSVAELKGEERSCNVSLEHLGYGLQKDEQDKKNRRNRKLLERMVKEEPGNAYAHFTLAQNYGLTGEQEKAVKHYKIAYQNNTFETGMQCSLLNTMAEALMKLQRYEQAEKYCFESIGKIREQVGAYYMLYRIAAARSQEELALQRLLELEKQNKWLQTHSKKLSTDVLFSGDDLAYELAKNYEKTGRLKQAMQQLQKLSDSQKEKAQVQQRILNLALQCEEFFVAEKILQKPEFQNELKYLDVLGVVKIKLQKFEEAIAIYEKLNKLSPNNGAVLKRLAGLYAKTGREEDYRRVLSKLQL